jgi:hypothetical protein
MSNTERPLWRVMEDAHRKEAGCIFDHLGNTVLGEPDRFTRAAELRAIAEEIDHRVAQCLDDDPAEIATWLRAEAARAEAEQ